MIPVPSLWHVLAGHKSCSVCEKDRRLAYDTGASKYDSEIDWDEWMMGISKLRKTLLSNATGRVLEVSNLNTSCGGNPTSHDCSGECRLPQALDETLNITLRT